MTAAWLREDVAIVPLIDRWYAWPHIIAPATAALNVAKRHLPILDSYARAPAVHARAVRDARNLGGPFVDYEADRSEEIRALAAETRRRRADLLRFADDLQALRGLLDTGEGGAPLEPLYVRVPDRLRGYVELVHDLHGRPAFRLIEELLYRSPHYVRDMQAIALRRDSATPRAFALSTPTLDAPNVRIIQAPFAGEIVDRLASARIAPIEPAEFLAALGIEERDHELFFTEAPPPPPPPPARGLRVRVLGHASVLVEHAGTAVLVDPAVGYARARNDGGWTFADLPARLDAVVITHAHQDHLFLETLLQLRGRTGATIVARASHGELADPSPAIMFRALGFQNVIEAPILEPVTVDSIQIQALPFFGEHGDLAIAAKAGYALTAGEATLVFLADARNVEPRLAALVRAQIPPVNALFIGMECDGAPVSWLYGPLFPSPLRRDLDGARRLSGSNSDEAFAVVEAFSPRRVLVYAMGQEPWLRHVMSKLYTAASIPIVEATRFVNLCHGCGVPAERLVGPTEIEIPF